jgi:hypothetical protein
MFKVFAFLKRNTALLSHDEYRAGHVGYHCGQSRRLKDIRGYLVNIWANVSFRDKVGDDHYQQLTIAEPEGFLNWWDGFPEVYFDDQTSWVNALTVEPNRATEDGLVIDPDWSLADGPVLFDPVPDRPGEFKPCHILVHEHIIVPVERAEQRAFKLIAFFRRRSDSDTAATNSRINSDYAARLASFRNLRGCILNFRDEDEAAAMRGFYPDDSWGHSEEGVRHRAEFCALWDGAIEYHFDTLDEFLAARAMQQAELAAMERDLFDSLWYVEVDENLVVLPNRDPAPDFYFR